MSGRKKPADPRHHHEKRRDKRFEKPHLVMAFGGRTYPTLNWSLGGALLLGNFGNTEIGRVIEGKLGMFDDKPRYPFTARVVRLESEGSRMAIQFAELGDGAFRLLQRYAMDRAE